MSPQHRRYATLAELVELLAPYSHLGYMAGKRATGTESRRSESGEEVMVPFEQLSEASKDISRAAAAAMLDGLAALGVPITTLIKIMDDADGPAEPVNLTERPEDTVRRFAGDLIYAQELLAEGRSIMAEMDKATGERLNRETLDRARLWHTASGNFPHKPEGV